MIRWIQLVLVYIPDMLSQKLTFSYLSSHIFFCDPLFLFFPLLFPDLHWLKSLWCWRVTLHTLLNGPRRASPSPVVRKKTQVIHWFYPKLNENLTYNDIAKTEELRKRIDKENANLNQKHIYSFFLCLGWFILSWMKHWGQSWIKWCKPHFYGCWISLTQFSFSWIFICSFPQVYCRVDSG